MIQTKTDEEGERDPWGTAAKTADPRGRERGGGKAGRTGNAQGERRTPVPTVRGRCQHSLARPNRMYAPGNGDSECTRARIGHAAGTDLTKWGRPPGTELLSPAPRTDTARGWAGIPRITLPGSQRRGNIRPLGASGGGTAPAASRGLSSARPGREAIRMPGGGAGGGERGGGGRRRRGLRSSSELPKL